MFPFGPDGRCAGPASVAGVMGVVLVTYNNEDHIGPALDALAAAATGPMDVVVVDNASADSTVATVRRDHPGVRVLAQSENLGFAKACNLGARTLESELVLFLNPDTVVDEDALRVGAEAMREDPSIGILGGRTRYPDGRLNSTCCFGRPTLWSALCDALGLNALGSGTTLFNPEHLGGWDRDDTRDVDVVTGCFLLIRRDVFEEVGGFDERFFLYSEDTDLSLRVRRSGRRCVHHHRVGLVHAGGGSDTVRSAKLVKVFAARAVYYRKHWTRPAVAAGTALLDLRVLTRLLAAQLRGEPHRTHWQQIWRQRAAWHPRKVSIA